MQRLCDGMVRARFRDDMDRPSLIELRQIYHYSMDCWNTCQMCNAGHRIGLEVSSSTFLKYDCNLKTSVALGQMTEKAVAEHRIYHDAEHPSRVVLPLIPHG